MTLLTPQRRAFFRLVLPLMLFYIVVSEVAQTLLFTIVTYFVTATGKSGVEFGNTVNEIADQYRLFSYALGTLLATLTLWLGDKALYRHRPFWNDPHKPFWQLDRFAKEELLRGASSGFLAAFVYLVIFTVSRQVSFLGTLITSSVGTPVFPLFFLDLVSLVVLVVCDEFLFRHKILRGLLTLMPPNAAVLLTSCFYILAKHLQFTLAPLDYLNLICLNAALGFFYLKAGKCHRGLGFLVLLFGTLHPLAGLPLWAQESPSFFLFKESHRATQLLSGGATGPMGGLGLFSILLFFTIGGHYMWKRSDKRDAYTGAQATK